MQKILTTLGVAVPLTPAWCWQQGGFALPPEARFALAIESSPRMTPGPGADADDNFTRFRRFEAPR